MPQPAKRWATPNPVEVQQVLNLLSAARYSETETAASQLASRFPDLPILHHALGVARDGLGKHALAIESYRKAIRLQPRQADLHFNLGVSLAREKRYAEAIDAYRQAISLDAKSFKAHANLGVVYQTIGRLEEAVSAYERALAIEPRNAQGHFNLGTALRALGRLDAAAQSYERAIECSPQHVEAHNNLGETMRDQGDMEKAFGHFSQALSLDPQHPRANYNLAEIWSLAGRFDEASRYFERSQLDDWQARSLYCLYKAEHFDRFKARLTELASTSRHTSPFIATLAAHYAINFRVENPYRFCQNAQDLVYQRGLPELTRPDSPLLAALLRDIDQAEIEPRAQAMLHFGQQSAGNLFKRPEASFQALAALVKQAFVDYRQTFAAADCELIRSFPETLEFTSSWYVKMKQGGHLDSHVHESGWISGAVYLSMPSPTQDPDEGAFEYGHHGDHYPQKHADFPVGRVRPRVGEIVLFPSSLFHRTVPFHADESRICIAFDLKPDEGLVRSAR